MASIDDSVSRLSLCDCLTCIKCTASDPSVVGYNNLLFEVAHVIMNDIDKGKTVANRLRNSTRIGRGWSMTRRRRVVEMEEVSDIPTKDVTIDHKIEASNLDRDNVWIRYNDRISPILEKTSIQAREVLLHYQLSQLISNEGAFKDMVPSLIHSSVHYSIDVKMEYVRGHLLHSRWHKLDPTTQRDTLVVIHYFLSFAYDKMRFTHGDLSTSNIILREEEGRTWSWSIPTVNGQVSITLPFCPTLIDFEYSSSHTHAYFDSFSSPYRNESADILRLYGLLLRYFSDDQEPLKSVKDHLTPLLGDWWFGCEDDDQYIPTPLPLLHPSLTHRALIELLLK